MRGLWLDNQRLSYRVDLDRPRPPGGEALVRVLQAGVCNTDLELVRGYYPYSGVLGHEFVGVVEEGSEGLVGKRAVGEINVVCHRCRACREARPSHCAERTVLGIVNRHGAFAEYLALPEENLHLVPDGVSTDAATFTEPLAAALEVQEQIEVTAADRVLVVGDGKLGQLIAQTLALTGCDLLVAGRHEAKLSLLAARGIATTTGDALADGECDVAVECTGNQGGFELARRSLRPRGTLVLKSTYADRLTFDVSSVVVDEITLIGSRCGPFAPALELLAENKVDVEPLIHARYPLSDGVVAFKRAQRPGVLKVILDIDGAA